MTDPIPALARPRARRAATLIAGLMVIGASLPVGAQSPSPAAIPPAPTTSPETTVPDLTFAPLVTLPPIAVPPVRDTAAIEDGYSIGAPDAPVQMEVWEDFQCPYCARWTFQVEPLVLENLVKTGLVRLTFRPMAFLGEESRWAVVAADLAAEQNRFWPFHDILFANQLGENVGSFGLDRLLAVGEMAGLDMDAYRAGLVLDVARERFARIQAASNAGAQALGITGTPSVVVNGTRLEAPDFESIVAAVQVVVGVANSPAASAAPGAPSTAP